jgi:threonine/homoserine efflux transporter RhtA
VLTTTEPVELPPNLEAETLNRIKRRLLQKSPFRILALAFTGLAIARIMSDTTFTASPKRFVATAIAALVCWVLYGWHTRRLRLAGLSQAGKR